MQVQHPLQTSCSVISPTERVATVAQEPIPVSHFILSTVWLIPRHVVGKYWYARVIPRYCDQAGEHNIEPRIPWSYYYQMQVWVDPRLPLSPVDYISSE